MSNPTVSAPNRGINQIMNADDVGNLFQKNKNLLITLFVLIVVVVIGFGLYAHFSDQSQISFNSKIYQFEQGPLKKYSETGSDVTALIQGFKDLHHSVTNYVGLLPVVIKTSDALVAHKNLNEALEVLNVGQAIAKNEYHHYFVLARLAAAYEDLGQDQKAIETLEQMNSSQIKIFEGKNYLDLGRIYLKSGNKEKAKSSFQYVVDKANGEAEFVKIAKLYLGKM